MVTPIDTAYNPLDVREKMFFSHVGLVADEIVMHHATQYFAHVRPAYEAPTIAKVKEKPVDRRAQMGIAMYHNSLEEDMETTVRTDAIPSFVAN